MIPAAEYRQRRQRLMELMGPDTMAVVAAAPRCFRSNDVPWPYRQDSDFLYLTGFREPDAVLVLLPGRRNGEQILFCRPESEDIRLWHGEVTGLEAAVETLGVDDAYPIEDLDDILPGLLEDRHSLYYSLGRHQELDQRLMEWTRRLRLMRERRGCTVPEQFHSLEYLLHEMRLIKSPSERQAVQRAVEASVDCHLACWRQIRHGLDEGLHEKALAGFFHWAAARQGLELAYPPIVAAGRNACVLHHEPSLQRLEPGRLLLMDAGVEWDGYAADITRCIPLSGRYDARDRTLLDIVLAARDAAAATLRPGRRWRDVHLAAVRVITAGLVDLGLLQGEPDGLVEQGAYRPYFMTRTGHWLGLDVHDAGGYRQGDRVLEAGMVVALEPGVLIRPEHAGRKRSWYHRVMRVEDDYLIGPDGACNLSQRLPAQADAVEAVLQP